jgi:hypothetical protein
MKQIIEEGRSRATELVPKAIRAVESDLDNNNGRVGLSLLAGVGVLKSGGSVTVNVALSNSESWYQRHCQPLQHTTVEPDEIPPKA